MLFTMPLDYMVQTFGFSSVKQFIKDTFPMTGLKIIIPLSFICALAKLIFGTPLEYLIFIVLGIAVEVGMGAYAAVVIKGESFNSRKFGRFAVKIVVFLATILITNLLRVSFLKLDIQSEPLRIFINYTLDTLFCFSLLLIGLYLVLSIAENGAKMKISFFVSLAKILKININKVEDLAKGSNNDTNLK